MVVTRPISGEQRRALEIMADSPQGCTEGMLRAHGFTVALLARIVRPGLAGARPEIVKAGGRTLSMQAFRQGHEAFATGHDMGLLESRERQPEAGSRK
jgi:hypothetical protein